MNATCKDGQPAGLRSLVESNVPGKGCEIATHLALILNDNISAENSGVALDFAADSNIAAKARDFREFLTRSHENVMPKLSAVVRAIGKTGCG